MSTRYTMVSLRCTSLAIATMMVGLQFAHAQAVINTSTAFRPPAARASDPHTRTPALSDIRSAFAKLGPLAQWGPITFRPHMLFRYTYGDGFLNPTQSVRQSASVYMMNTGALLEIGKYWTADYGLTKVFSSNEFLSDSLDHDASVAGSIAKDDWSLRVSQSYRTNAPVLAETGQQTRQEYYATIASASYEVGPSTMVELSGTHSTRLANSDVDTPEWTTADWRSLIGEARVHYQLSPRLRAGAGIEYSQDKVSQSPAMTAVQPHIQVTWRPTMKITMSGQLGSETRRIGNDQMSDLENRVYSLSIQYEPIATTSFSVSASQSVSASFFANQASKSRTLGFNVSQRLLGKLFFAGGLTFGENRYIATSAAFISGRKDEFTSFNVQISIPVIQRGSVGAFVSRSRNKSNTGAFDYTSDQFGGEVGYRF